MSRLFKMFQVLAVALIAGTAVVAQTEAAIISISPVTQDASIGDTVFVDILVSGLTADESVGGVSLELWFNPAILSGLSYTPDPDDKMGFAADLDFSFGFDGGVGSPLDLFFLASGLLDHAALKALQGDGFRLATVSFTALAAGLSPLTLRVSPSVGIFLSDADGAELPATARNGDVCVGGSCTVPEPGLLALLGAGLLGAAVRRRARPQA